MVLPEAAGKPDSEAERQAVRSRSLQPEDRARLPPEGGIRRVLEIQVPVLGGEVPEGLDHQGDAVEDRADEGLRQDPEGSQGAPDELVPGKEGGHLAGRRGGAKQQGESDHQKSVWISDLPRRRNRPLSRTWGSARATDDPQILLTKLFGSLRQIFRELGADEL